MFSLLGTRNTSQIMYYCIQRQYAKFTENCCQLMNTENVYDIILFLQLIRHIKFQNKII